MYSLILSLSEIPEGTSVTKITGEKPYTVTQKITVYGKTGDPDAPTFEPIQSKGIIFLVDDAAGIRAYPEHTKVKVTFDSVGALQEFIDTHLVVHQ